MLTANSASAFALRRGATRTRVVVTLIGLALVLAADATPGSPLASLRNWVFDAYQRYCPSARSGHPIVIIDIDAASIRHIGQWPWPRDHLARLVAAAAAARVIGIDLLLAEQTVWPAKIERQTRPSPRACGICPSFSPLPPLPRLTKLRCSRPPQQHRFSKSAMIRART